MLPNWIKFAIDARVHRELFYRLLNDGQLQSERAGFLRGESTRFAYEAGKENPRIAVPLLLLGDSELEEFFIEGQQASKADNSGPELGDMVYLTAEEGFSSGWYEVR